MLYVFFEYAAGKHVGREVAEAAFGAAERDRDV